VKETHPDIPQERTTPDQGKECGYDINRGRKDKCISYNQRCNCLPEEQGEKNGENTKPFIRNLPSTQLQRNTASERPLLGISFFRMSIKSNQHVIHQSSSLFVQTVKKKNRNEGNQLVAF
jgi:hypothetical protein